MSLIVAATRRSRAHGAGARSGVFAAPIRHRPVHDHRVHADAVAYVTHAVTRHVEYRVLVAAIDPVRIEYDDIRRIALFERTTIFQTPDVRRFRRDLFDRMFEAEVMGLTNVLPEQDAGVGVR